MKRLSENVRFLEKSFDLLNEHFFESVLSKPVITIQSSPKTYGHCSCQKVWVDSIESYYEINIAAESLDRPIQNTIATLVHEMVHLFCLQNDIQDTSRGGTYHNKRFKTEAENRGLSISYDKKIGWSVTQPTDTLIQFIQDNKLEQMITYHREETKPDKKKKKASSTRKYTCPLCGSSVRATKEVHVLCADCEMMMECEN